MKVKMTMMTEDQEIIPERVKITGQEFSPSLKIKKQAQIKNIDFLN